MMEIIVQRRDQRDVTMWILFHGPPGGPQSVLCGVQVARLAKQEPQPLQSKSGNAVTRGCRVIGHGFRPVHELLVIVGSEIEASIISVIEMLEQQLGKAHCQFEVFERPARLQQLQKRVEQKRVVVQVGR